MPPLPPAYVCGVLRGGPHDGETRMMPWAMTEIPVLSFPAGGAAVTSLYRLNGFWRGQSSVEYCYSGFAA